MVTNVSSQLTCQVFLETMKTCLSSSVQYKSENGGNISRARMQKPYLASFRRFCALCFNMIHRHTWIYKAHILTKSTERASLQLQSTASNATSQNAAFTTVVEDQHNLPGHTPLHILFGEQICWSRLVGYQNGICLEEWDTNSFPSFLSDLSSGLLSSRLHLQILGFPDNVL